MPELSPVTVRAPLRAKSPGGEPPTSLTLKALGSLKAESTRGERGQSRLQPSVRGWRQQSHTPQHQPRARPDLHRGKGTARPGGGVDAGEGSPGPGRRVQGTGETACPLHVARQSPRTQPATQEKPSSVSNKGERPPPGSRPRLPGHVLGRGCCRLWRWEASRCHRGPAAKGPCAPRSARRGRGRGRLGEVRCARGSGPPGGRPGVRDTFL